ncbi:MAG: phage tail family protein [Bacteroidaceae bacterium]|nr:phage tail family protein [Bacteroidaceae bacterium]
MSRTASYRGVSFDSLGLMINKTIVPPCGASKRQTISIPDGPVIIEDTKTRSPIEINIECTLIEDNKLRDIYALVQEEGKLTIPDEPGKYYYGILTISTPKNIILYYNRITFKMIAEPYAYADDEHNPEILCTLTPINWYKYSVVTNTGTAPAEPVYRVTAENNATNFDLWTEHNGSKVAGCRFEINGGETYIIDVRNHIVYDGNDHIVLNKTVEDFSKVVLLPGENSICVSNALILKVTKNERWY